MKNGVICKFEESHVINQKMSLNTNAEREKVFSSEIFHSGTFRKISEDQGKSHIIDKTVCSSEDINLMQNSDHVFVEIKEKSSGRITSQNNRYTVRDSEAITSSLNEFCNSRRTVGSADNQNSFVPENTKLDLLENSNKQSFSQKRILN